MKIVILDHEPYSDRRKKHFFINKFRSEGVEIEFWSLWKILGYSKHLKYEYAMEGEAIFYLESRQGLEERLKRLDYKTTFVFVEFWSNSYTLYILELLNKAALKWGRLEYYHNPVSNFYSSFREATKIKRLVWVKILFNRLLDKEYLRYQLISRFYKQYFNSLNTANVNFLTGSNRRNVPLSNKTVSIDYFDVETFNNELPKPALLDYPYIVFADIYLGKHPDLQIANSKPYMDIEMYYQRLNLFFSKIESQLEMPVVIAAHPKASYDNNEFCDRLCIKNETANLIINSKMMIQHCSLSLSFALLSKKNVIQFYDNVFIGNPVLNDFYKIMKGISVATDSSCINIDESFDIKILYNRKVNVAKYNDILQRYFTKNSEEKRDNFEIIYNSIGNLFID